MFMPIPLDKDDWSPCSYLFLFSPENYAASHYSFIWAQVSYGGVPGIYKMFMPIPLDKDDWSPCSYLFLFSPENYAASHYSFIWAQVSYGGGGGVPGIYKMFMPIPLDKDDWSPCSHLFLFSSENYAASHYSFIWAQVSNGGVPGIYI